MDSQALKSVFSFYHINTILRTVLFSSICHCYKCPCVAIIVVIDKWITR